MRPKILAAKIFLAIVLIGNNLVSGPLVQAGIPTIDIGSITQSIVIALESIEQTKRQIQQHQTQLKQYENELRNTRIPNSYIWSRAQITINDLLNTVDTLNYYNTQLGNLDTYLEMFRDKDYYINSSCFNGYSDCSTEEMEELEASNRLADESVRRARNDWFHAIENQETSLNSDAIELHRLQTAAQSADGQLQALGYANQFASHQIAQLLQIRGALFAQQQFVAIQAAQQQQQTDRDQAKERVMTGGSYQRHVPKTF